jgi:glutaconyl-CoA/methylmalonyl-CoA decarboxylase subunit gamma
MGRKFNVTYNEDSFEVELNLQNKQFIINDQIYSIEVENSYIKLDEKVINLDDVIKISDTRYRIHHDGFTVDFNIVDSLISSLRDAELDGGVNSPMSGVITKLLVKNGDKVEKGKPLLVLSAMKMENEINSPVSGVVSKIHVDQNQSVNTNDLLLEISVKKST